MTESIDETAPLTAFEADRLAQNEPAVSELYLKYATLAFARRPFFTAAEAVAFSCLARAHHALKSILILGQSREVDCAVLARILYEHIVVLAWLAIAPDAHQLQLATRDFHSRREMYKDLAAFAGTPPISMELVELVALGDGYDPTVKSPPKLEFMAGDADAYWQPRVKEWPFNIRRAFASLYRSYSAAVHPMLVGLAPFCTMDPGMRIGSPEPTLTVRLDAEALVLFGDGLVIMSQAFGWPPLREVISAVFAGLAATPTEAK